MPLLLKLLNKLGYGIFPKKSLEFFNSFINAAMTSRRSGDSEDRNDFVQLVINQEVKHRDVSKTDCKGTKHGYRGLTQLDIQGQTLIFILAGYDTVSIALSFTLFLLAHHPEVCTKVQEEIDTVLEGKFPTYETAQSLTYLDMCVNEAIRMYPPGFIVDRVCTKECEIQGIKIPKGMTVQAPLIGMYNDPELFPEQDNFDPDRFSAHNKAQRHPFAFLPFGQGPRNCIGMRLAQMEMRIAVAAILQEMTPVPCDKSVYPPKLAKFRMKAIDGLWVKFIPRHN